MWRKLVIPSEVKLIGFEKQSCSSFIITIFDVYWDFINSILKFLNLMLILNKLEYN
jgi:hypothetical protein